MTFQKKFKKNYNKDWITTDSFFIFYFSYYLLVLEYPLDICANITIIHYQHWSIIILINILITPFETSYALWLAKMDLFTVMPILRYYQRICVFIAEKKNNDSCKYHPSQFILPKRFLILFCPNRMKLSSIPYFSNILLKK